MRRLFALLQAVWLASLIAEPAALHACEMHAAGHATHASGAMDRDADADEHAHHGHESADAAPSVPDDAPPSACQCLGECCAAAAAALVESPAVPAVACIAAVPTRVDIAAQRPARAADLRLPFANGPPGTLTT